MAEQDLKTVLDTDFSKLEPALVEAINNLKKFEAALKKSTDTKEIEYLQRSIGALKDRIATLKPVPAVIPPSLTEGAKKAQYALTNLSRVASDAPFGFIAIQNNLEPLIGSFGALQKETGSAGGALKALASSLAGPAGIAVGFSVVSALVTTAIQKYGSLSAALDALFSSTDATALAQQQLNKANAEAVASVQGEVAGINALLSAAQDLSISSEQRQVAVKKLNQEYPKYLGNLTLENVNSAEAAASVAKLTAALERKARIAGVEKLITKVAEQQAQAYLDLQQNIKDTDSPLQTFVNGVVQSVTGTSASIKSIAGLNKEFTQQEQQLKVLQDALKQLTAEQVKNNEVETKSETIKKTKNKEAKEEVRVTRDYWKELATLNQEQENAFSKGTTGLMGKGGNGVLKQIEDLQAAGQKVAETFNKIGESISGTLGPAFTQLFDDILSGSQTAFQAFGQAIAGIIKKLIAAAITAAIFAAIVSVAFPGAAAGGASFAKNFGSLFGQLSGLKFADGGIVSGPTRALIGEAGPEAVIPLHKLDSIIGGNQNIFVTGVLSGENIYLQQQRTSARRSRFV